MPTQARSRSSGALLGRCTTPALSWAEPEQVVRRLTDTQTGQRLGAAEGLAQATRRRRDWPRQARPPAWGLTGGEVRAEGVTARGCLPGSCVPRPRRRVPAADAHRGRRSCGNLAERLNSTDRVTQDC